MILSKEIFKQFESNVTFLNNMVIGSKRNDVMVRFKYQNKEEIFFDLEKEDKTVWIFGEAYSEKPEMIAEAHRIAKAIADYIKKHNGVYVLETKKIKKLPIKPLEVENLNPLEAAILSMFLQNKSHQEIATAFEMEKGEVDYCIQRIRGKLS